VRSGFACRRTGLAASLGGPLHLWGDRASARVLSGYRRSVGSRSALGDGGAGIRCADRQKSRGSLMPASVPSEPTNAARIERLRCSMRGAVEVAHLWQARKSKPVAVSIMQADPRDPHRASGHVLDRINAPDHLSCRQKPIARKRPSIHYARAAPASMRPPIHVTAAPLGGRATRAITQWLVAPVRKGSANAHQALG
jgi:hypothetical protein